MSFRARVLLAMIAAALVPLGLFAAGVWTEASDRLTADEARRIERMASRIERDLAREAASVGRRVEAIASALSRDDRLRLALIGDVGADRRLRIDWAEGAMRLAGLDALQLHDSSGRIVSSGQFRNDFDRIEPPPRGMGTDTVQLAVFRTPTGPLVALTRSAEVRIGPRRFVIAGGVRLDTALLERFAGDEELPVELAMPDDTLRSVPGVAEAVAVREMAIPLAGIDRHATAVNPAMLRILRRGDALAAFRSEIDRWLLAAAAIVAMAAVVLGAWLSARLSRPLARLADSTGAITLSGMQALPDAGREDEIGTLARRLTSMARRLQRGAEMLREAERRATVGDMARQVNHDIKNGLVPIRNVLRHLADVQERTPERLADVFGERRHTLEASLGYLDALARHYARLAPRPGSGPVDVAAIARDTVASAAGGGAPVRFAGSAAPAFVHGDPLGVRRVLDNLVRNAVESLTTERGTVSVEVAERASGVRVTVTDDGRGMTEAELSRAVRDFHSTKPDGTGLGLSVVRRLTSDMGAKLRIESAPGRGTTVVLDLPAARVAMPSTMERLVEPPPRAPVA